MAFKLAEAFVEFRQKGLTKTQRAVTSLGGSMRSAGGIAKGFAASLAAVGIGLAARNAMMGAGEQIKAERKLEAVLKATGQAAGKSADEIKKLASSRQDITNFGDEATIAAAGMLATFKSIKGDVFDDALIAAQDLSAVMDQDLKSSTVQIGKALNDPIKGVTALTRVGVSFTQQQKDQIKVMQTSGDLMGAQTIILKELQSEFGGAAESMADPFIQFKNTFGDAMENIGFALRPIATELTGVLKSLMGPVTDNREAMTAWGESIANDLGPAVSDIADAFRGAGEAAGMASGQVNKFYNEIFGGQSLVGDLIETFGVMGRNWQSIIELQRVTWAGGLDVMLLEAQDFAQDVKAEFTSMTQDSAQVMMAFRMRMAGSSKEHIATVMAAMKLGKSMLMRGFADEKTERQDNIKDTITQNQAAQDKIIAEIEAAEEKVRQARNKPPVKEEEEPGKPPPPPGSEEEKKAKKGGADTLTFEGLAAKIQGAGENPVVAAVDKGNQILNDILGAIAGKTTQAAGAIAGALPGAADIGALGATGGIGGMFAGLAAKGVAGMPAFGIESDMDRLAELKSGSRSAMQGVMGASNQFQRAIQPAPIATPSRAALMAGPSDPEIVKHLKTLADAATRGGLKIKDAAVAVLGE